MKAAEKLHIQTVGQTTFDRAFNAAMFKIKQDARLTGLDKLRGAIAEEAALRATGYQKRPLILPRGCGKPDRDIQTICEQVLERAVEAAAA